MSEPLLSVENLRVEFDTSNGIIPVIDNLSFSLDKGDNISFIGESGCGKSMTSLAIMGLLPQPVGRIASGRIMFKGEDLTQVSARRMQQIRGNEISMIFQEPMTSLNPVYTIGEQIAEVLRLHRKIPAKRAWQRAVELLDAVQIPDPENRAAQYPHQLSGGQRQRVMIAIALACEPEILIADEPTTALDVTVQAEIFDLLRNLQKSMSTSIILITHDIAAAAQMTRRLLVMYAGRKIEEGHIQDVIDHPRHPYTKGLVSCIPYVQEHINTNPAPLTEIIGIVPPITQFGKDLCLFAPRCTHAKEQCHHQKPVEVSFNSNHCPQQHSSLCWIANTM